MNAPEMPEPELPDEVWEHLAELQHEELVAEMNAERTEDSATPESAQYWWRRAAELREEFEAYADKHGIQPDDEPEADRELERDLERAEEHDEEKETER